MKLKNFVVKVVVSWSTDYVSRVAGMEEGVFCVIRAKNFAEAAKVIGAKITRQGVDVAELAFDYKKLSKSRKWQKCECNREGVIGFILKCGAVDKLSKDPSGAIWQAVTGIERVGLPVFFEPNGKQKEYFRDNCVSYYLLSLPEL
jgi:hypothetical protein